MIQKGVVISTEGCFAKVEVERSSACVGCSRQDGCPSCKKKLRAAAYNELGAVPGDRVELESDSSKVLLYALLVFVLPIVCTLAVYLIVYSFSDSSALQIIASACIFVLIYVIIYFNFDRNPENRKTVRIKKIEEREDKE